jgi:hypothetical protein
VDPRQHVSPGDPISLAAEQINGLNRLLGTSGGFGGPATGEQPVPYTWVLCRSSVTVARWGVLAITGLEITPATAKGQASFESMPLVTGATPSATTTAWGIAVEPIAAGKVGRLAVGGVVQAKTSDLGRCGGYQLLWRDATWALIQIGGGLRLGTISATWSKGGTATVTDRYGDDTARPTSSTFTATNNIATLTLTSGTMRVACTKVDDKWLLVAWDWHSMQSYDGTKQQILGHAANGGLQWLNTTGCT